MTNNQLAENSVIQLLNSVKLARDNAERADNRADHSFYYALTIALEELQERRKAAAAPQSPGSEPATVPGKWVPVSERMPPSRHEVLVGRWWGEKPRWCCKWATYIPGHPDAQSSGWLIPGGSWTPTHWMELPAAPQEVKGE